MEITARLVADATVNNVKDNRTVVNFRVAVNDRFRTKDGEQKEVSTYFQCAYWLGSGVAKLLTKGTIVQVFGRVGVDAWTSSEGQPRASLTFHVNDLKLIGGGTKATGQEIPAEVIAGNDVHTTQGAKDDLPF